ncbi:MAG: hypothetical protein ACREDL_25435 [Bradyrhizobium sp.]
MDKPFILPRRSLQRQRDYLNWLRERFGAPVACTAIQENLMPEPEAGGLGKAGISPLPCAPHDGSLSSVMAIEQTTGKSQEKS